MRTAEAEGIILTGEGIYWLGVSFGAGDETVTVLNCHMPTIWSDEHEWHEAMEEINKYLDEAKANLREHALLLAGDTNIELRDISGDSWHMLLREATACHGLRGLAGVQTWTLRWRHPGGNYIEKATDTILCTSASAKTRRCTSETRSDHRVVVCTCAGRRAFRPRAHHTEYLGSVGSGGGPPARGGSSWPSEQTSLGPCPRRAHVQASSRRSRVWPLASQAAPHRRASRPNSTTSGIARAPLPLAGRPYSRGSPT